MENVSPVVVDMTGTDIRADGVTIPAGEPVLMTSPPAR